MKPDELYLRYAPFLPEAELKGFRRDIGSVEQGVCKWQRLTPKQGGNWEATCQDDVVTFSNLLVHEYFKYCPFCGRKIERV